MPNMKAIGVEKYGDVKELKALEVPKPENPQGHDVLVRIKAVSVNPVDVKVRAGTYDDYVDFYSHAPKPPHIIGFDASGIIDSVGPDVSTFQPGDEVFYSANPMRQGTNAEFQLVDSKSIAKKPKNLDWLEAAALPLTYITAYEALTERMGIQKGEDAAILIINGSGGVGAVASQIARNVLHLPAVITTTSRPETTSFSKSMGASHTVNHRSDIVSQVRDLGLPHPLKYILIAHRTEAYLAPCAAIAAPFAKICSIVQTKEFPMYGTEFMEKGLTFVWELLSTKGFYGVGVGSHGEILEELRGLVEGGVVKGHLKKRLRLTVGGLREAHEALEGGGVMGKVALGVEEEGEGEAFA